jgi:hypothetical protein
MLGFSVGKITKTKGDELMRKTALPVRAGSVLLKSRATTRGKPTTLNERKCKMTKTTKTTKATRKAHPKTKRTQIKDLAVEQQELTAEDAHKVKGGHEAWPSKWYVPEPSKVIQKK